MQAALCLGLFVLALACNLQFSLSKESTSFNIIGYVPDWRYNTVDWDAIAKHLTHIVLFSVEPTPTGSLTALDRLPNKDIMAKARTAANNNGVKLMMSIGGSARSSAFASATKTEQSRASFVKSIQLMCDAHNLDGVDFNWEAPEPENEEQWQACDKKEKCCSNFNIDLGILSLNYVQCLKITALYL